VAELGFLFEEEQAVTLQQDSKTLSFGVDYDMPYSRGQGFAMIGQHNRAWAFISREGWGSDRDFFQAYLSSRWHFLAGDRWKFLLRGEVGYSDAEVRETTVIIEDALVDLSVTQLPNLYRFKAGGSNSVRGYSFESLSNNNIGSNNVITASVEAEMKLFENWSLAAFVDVGNAFNDWSEVDVKTGWGLGVRWYTIAGAIRVDFAQGLDLADDPWRIHFTIGTSLL
jgi:translocation and assembly module TamA